jgi:hypothetical protein
VSAIVHFVARLFDCGVDRTFSPQDLHVCW